MRAVVYSLLLATAVVAAAPVQVVNASPSADSKRDKPKAQKDSDAGSDSKKPDKKPDKKTDKKTATVDPKQAEPPAPRKPGPDDAKAVAILEKIVAGPDAAARKAAIAELEKLAPHTIDAIAEWLQRPRQVDLVERRKVLDAIKASVPDKTGKFSTPDRQSNKDYKADDELDWLAKLLAVDPAMTGVGEVIADVAGIRALAGTKDVRAAQLVFNTAFNDEAMIYRDECGRYLRKMEAYAIPALTRESQGRNYDRKRYATWQLERQDRQDPNKAMSAAMGNEAVQIAILDVFRETHHREAVHAVWSFVDDSAPRVRAAARAAWMDYITGPPPRPAPRKKLQLPGGKLTKKEKPLWLTYRELADNELRKSANELLHEDYPLDDPYLDDFDHNVKTVKVDLQELTKRLFDYYDGLRAKTDAAQWLAAKTTADKGDLATATAMLDRLITTNPERAERAEMAKVYLAYAKQLETSQKWAEASAAYSKAHGLDPKQHSLAASHYTLGKSLEAAGKDGGPDFRRAVALDPEYAPAKTAAEHVEPGRPVWMLYTAFGAAGIAMLLFVVAMMRRRAT
jgi:tetratricopeptide (TPR) repeat protein